LHNKRNGGENTDLQVIGAESQGKRIQETAGGNTVETQ